MRVISTWTPVPLPAEFCSIPSAPLVIRFNCQRTRATRAPSPFHERAVVYHVLRGLLVSTLNRRMTESGQSPQPLTKCLPCQEIYTHPITSLQSASPVQNLYP